MTGSNMKYLISPSVNTTNTTIAPDNEHKLNIDESESKEISNTFNDSVNISLWVIEDKPNKNQEIDLHEKLKDY